MYFDLPFTKQGKSFLDYGKIKIPITKLPQKLCSLSLFFYVHKSHISIFFLLTIRNDGQ